MRSLARAASLALVAAAGLAVVLSASGWLYLLGPGGAGPQVADALPLDELPHHAAVSLPAFVAVWAGAALALGLLTRRARIDRLTAAAVLALSVSAYSFLTTGVSLLIVRQIPALDAFHAAARMPAVYLPAALAGSGGALLARKRPRDWPLAPALLAAVVAAAGLVDVVAGVFPEYGQGLLAQLAPHAVQGITHALVAPTGLALIVTARGLARRKQRAWQLAVALLGSSAALHLVHSLDYSAAATVTVALALIARRQDFTSGGDRSRNPRIILLGAGLLATLYSYGALALWTNRLMLDRPITAGYALRETTAALLGSPLHGSGHLTGAFGGWFALSVFLLGLTAAGILLATWLAPWRYRLRQSTADRDRTHALVERYGTDTLAPFALRADKSYFFANDGQAFLAYTVVAGIAVISGDPVGPGEALPQLLDHFRAFARARGWRIAVLGVREDSVALYRSAGLRVLYHGDEAVVDPREFSLDGRAIRKVRQSVTRLKRQGYETQVLYARDIDGEQRRELSDVFDEWRGDAPTKGFTMELDTLFRLDGGDALFVVGRGPDGTVQGFLHFVFADRGRALSLSSMPRRTETPNGLNECLVVTAIEWAKMHELARVSLNFAPFAALFASEDRQRLSAGKRLQRHALTALKGHGFQLENLLAFNRKFFPQWEHRYVAYERRADLPRVGLASLAAEGYLPLHKARP